MSQENTQTGPDAVETDPGATKGFEGMVKQMEQCSCCGDMMDKMKGFMSAMCCSSDDNDGRTGQEGKAEPNSRTENKPGETTGHG